MPAGSAEESRADDFQLPPPPPNEIVPEHPSSLDSRKDARPAYTSVPEPPEPGAPGIIVSGELLPDEIFEEVLRRRGIERPRGPGRRVVTGARSPSRDGVSRHREPDLPRPGESHLLGPVVPDQLVDPEGPVTGGARRPVERLEDDRTVAAAV